MSAALLHIDDTNARRLADRLRKQKELAAKRAILSLAPSPFQFRGVYTLPSRGLAHSERPKADRLLNSRRFVEFEIERDQCHT